MSEFDDVIKTATAPPSTIAEALEPVAALDALSATPDQVAAALREIDVESLSAVDRELAYGTLVDLLDRLGMKRPTSTAKAALRLNEKTSGDEQPRLFADVEPWPESVGLAEVLDELVGAARRFVILPDHAAEALALWATHTYAFDRFGVSPKLALLSPTPRCGKTRLLEFLAAVVSRPLVTSGISAAALFRVIDRDRPTLLIDECDTFVNGDEDLRGVLNSGHSRTGTVARCDGDKNEVKVFSTFAPVALAGIGRLPATVLDRSVIIEMRRRAPGESIESARGGRMNRALDPIRRKLARWSADEAEELGHDEPEFPTALDDRAADNWESLLAIADAARGIWPETARRVAVALSAGRDDDESNARILILRDMRSLFAELGDRIRTDTALERLNSMDDRPWPEWRRGKPLTSRALAKLLVDYGIRPRVLRIEGGTSRGYRRGDFRDAFSRYVTEEGGPTRNSVTSVASQGLTTTTKRNTDGELLRDEDYVSPYAMRDVSLLRVDEGEDGSPKQSGRDLAAQEAERYRTQRAARVPLRPLNGSAP